MKKEIESFNTFYKLSLILNAGTYFTKLSFKFVELKILSTVRNQVSACAFGFIDFECQIRF